MQGGEKPEICAAPAVAMKPGFGALQRSAEHGAALDLLVSADDQ
jgi:hypothetical protein